MTRLAGADALVDLDPVFAEFARGAGEHLWGLDHLTAREKAFVCLTADLCHPHLGTPLAMHYRMAVANGVEPEAIRELFRHLAPYVGYPVLVTAFQRLTELGLPPARDAEPVSTAPLAAPLADTARELASVDPGLAAFAREQFSTRWARSTLTIRERALACLVVDILYQTLGPSLQLHAALARYDGATEDTLRDLLRGVAEFGMPRAWAAATALGCDVGGPDG